LCTAQVLLAVMASMYAIYPGAEGLRRIAERVHGLALVLAQGLRRLGCQVASENFFDTVHVTPKEESADRTLARAYEHRINLRRFEDGSIGIALDEVTTTAEVQALFDIFAAGRPVPFTVEELAIHMDLSFPAVSLQPKAGSQGEYAGLLVIRAYHQQRGESRRDVCLIPVSAHGTNPASATMVGLKVVPVACDEQGNVDLADLEAKAKQYRQSLAALMITYPSTHGVFEEGIRRICAITHAHGGQVYMDGANM